MEENKHGLGGVKDVQQASHEPFLKNEELQEVEQSYYYEDDEGVGFGEYPFILKLFIISLAVNFVRLLIEGFNYIDKPMGLSFIVPLDFIFAIFIAYTIIAFIRHTPNAVFLGRVCLLMEFLLDAVVLISNGFDDSLYLSLFGRMVWLLIWFLYFHFAEDAFPKEYRKTYKRDYYIVALLVVVSISLYVGNLIGNTYNFVKASDQYSIEYDSLSDREHTDGLIAFANPEACACEKIEVDNGVVLHHVHSDNFECIIVGDFYLELNNEIFEKYKKEWTNNQYSICAKDELTTERHTTYNGDVYWVATTKYYDLDFVVMWDFIIILDEETRKSCLISCYYQEDSDCLKKQILNSVRFK